MEKIIINNPEELEEYLIEGTYEFDGDVQFNYKMKGCIQINVDGDIYVYERTIELAGRKVKLIKPIKGKGFGLLVDTQFYLAFEN